MRNSSIKKILTGLLGAALVISPQSGFSEAPSQLSLNQALQMGLSQSEDLQIKGNDLEKRKAQVREAIGTALPQISAEARWQKYFKSPVFFGSPVPIEYQFESGVSVSQVLWAFGRVSSALKAAQAGLKIGEIDQYLSKQDTQYQIKMSYYSVLLAEEQLKISSQTLQNAKDNLAILQRKFSGGRAPQGDLVRLRSDVAVRTAQLNSSTADLKQAQWGLARLIGRPNLDGLTLSDPFPTQFKKIDESALKKQILETQPRLKILEEQIKFNSEVVDIQRSASLPTLALFGSANYSGAGSQADIGSDNLYPSTLAGLSLSWNLWDGGQSRAKYRQAIVDRSNAELGLQKSRELLEVAYKSQLNNYKTQVESFASSREAVQLAEQSFKIAQRRFQTGQASVTEVNSTESALTQARLGLALNLFSIHSSLAELDNLAANQTLEKSE